MNEIFFSVKRKQELEAELHTLQTVERASIAEEIETAKSHGDLSENAEYHAARERQAKIEDRIGEVQYMLNHGRLTDSSNTDIVCVGHQVTVKNTSTDNQTTYTIVGQEEQDIMNGLISNASPIAISLLGNKVDDIVHYETPRGKVEIQIVNIESK